MGSGRSPSLPVSLSGCLCLCQAISNLHFSKSFLTNGKVNEYPSVVSPAVSFLVGSLLCVPLALFPYIQREREW